MLPQGRQAYRRTARWRPGRSCGLQESLSGDPSLIVFGLLLEEFFCVFNKTAYAHPHRAHAEPTVEKHRHSRLPAVVVLLAVFTAPGVVAGLGMGFGHG